MPTNRALPWLLVVAAAGCAPPPPPPEDYPVVHHQPAETWYAPLYRDPANPVGAEEGRIRVLVGVQLIEYEDDADSVVTHGLRIRLSGLRPATGYAARVEGEDAPVPFTADGRGEASVLLGRSLPAPGKRITVADGSGNPVLLGAMPDWTRRPRGETLREVFDGDDGSVRVRAFSGSGKGREELEFRCGGFPDGARLAIGGSAGIPVASGGATLRWRSGDGAPLPLGAATVRELHGTPFEVRSVSGAVLVEGTIP